MPTLDVMDQRPPASPRQRDAALSVLLHEDLEPIVDMVGWSRGSHAYEVASATGALRFRRVAEDGSAFEVEGVEGSNPLANGDPAAFGDLAAERATPHPSRQDNSYPDGYAQFAQLCGRLGRLTCGKRSLGPCDRPVLA